MVYNYIILIIYYAFMNNTNLTGVILLYTIVDYTCIRVYIRVYREYTIEIVRIQKIT